MAKRANKDKNRFAIIILTEGRVGGGLWGVGVSRREVGVGGCGWGRSKNEYSV